MAPGLPGGAAHAAQGVAAVRLRRALELGRFALVLALAWLASAPAAAHVTRYALLVGNDRGTAGQVELQYAERDAEKMYQVLRDVGSFDPANMVLLQGERADVVEQTLVTLNERIRTTLETPGDEVLFLVYYSGHADAEALQLDGTRLLLTRFAQLVRGSSATFRVLVLDACRSGMLTRKKGGRIAPAFSLETESSLPGSGMAFLTASAAHEDAQESDAISGSFFTHALVSGMLGAADENADGAVALDEAYSYAYDTTLRATARSLAGAQHPTFQYDLRGQGKLVLTRPFERGAERAVLEFPRERNYLLLRDHAGGAVVAEVGVRDRARVLSARPGRYYVIGRAETFLLEGTLDVRAGERQRVEDGRLERVAYARLVRKGGSEHASAGPFVGYAVRSALPNAESVCHGPLLGFTADLEELSIRPRVSVCRSSLENDVLAATSDELDGELRFIRAFDFRRLSLGVGFGAGGGLFRQRFDTTRVAPDRHTGYGALLVAVELDLELGRGVFALLDAAGKSYFFSLRNGGDRAVESAFALRGALSLGKRF
jgi:hypothetical protein